MAVKKSILPHDSDIRLAINEFVCSHTINRNLQLLQENDDACRELYAQIFGGLKITSYSKTTGSHYDNGVIVWYYLQDKRLLEKGFAKLWFLQSVEDMNSNDPLAAFNDLNDYGQPDFIKYGWYDLNEHVDVFAPQFGLKQIIRQRISQAVALHQKDIANHPFGRVSAVKSSLDSLDKKVLLTTMANADPGRKHVFFPYQTGHFTTDSIVNGTYRVWDCGLLEFDIVFRLGYVETDSDGYDVLSCNNVRFQQSATKVKTANGYQENTKYFYSLDDMKMFQNPDSVNPVESVIGNMRQGNRNDYVNTYFAKLEFPKIVFNSQPVQFLDLNYMVFSSGFLCQDKDFERYTLVQNSNRLTWCDKTKSSIVAMLITCRDDGQVGFGENGGLAANSFSCSIVGKWK